MNTSFFAATGVSNAHTGSPSHLRSGKFALVIASLFCTLARAAGIAPDGTTATSVSVGSSGRQTVTIAAPVANGVSYNAYRDFNVGKPGADFINTGVNARVIVNEVTSTNPSLIEGDITIVGPRANFILANPNGITVNGGKFVNTGTLALSPTFAIQREIDRF